MFILSLMVAGIAAVLVSSYKIARSRVYAVGIVRKLPQSQDAVGEQAAPLPGQTEISPRNEPTAFDLSIEETVYNRTFLKTQPAARHCLKTSRQPTAKKFYPQRMKSTLLAARRFSWKVTRFGESSF